MSWIDDFNSASQEKAAQMIAAVCGSSKWIGKMIKNRPFENEEGVLGSCEEIWNSLTVADWKEAFSHHPRIGDLKAIQNKDSLAGKEQRGMATAQSDVLEEFANLNREYEKKFGMVFLICATGKTATQMLTALKTRIVGTQEEELQNSVLEQSKIMQLRLERLLKS